MKNKPVPVVVLLVVLLLVIGFSIGRISLPVAQSATATLEERVAALEEKVAALEAGGAAKTEKEEKQKGETWGQRKKP